VAHIRVDVVQPTVHSVRKPCEMWWQPFQVIRQAQLADTERARLYVSDNYPHGGKTRCQSTSVSACSTMGANEGSLPRVPRARSISARRRSIGPCAPLGFPARDTAPASYGAR
jgi:hypothetical protein